MPTKHTSSVQCDFQTAVIPCPPEHLEAWHKAIKIYWELAYKIIQENQQVVSAEAENEKQ